MRGNIDLANVRIGDIIDGNETEEKGKQDLDTVLKIFEQNKHKHVHVMGNHCLRFCTSLFDRHSLNVVVCAHARHPSAPFFSPFFALFVVRLLVYLFSFL